MTKAIQVSETGGPDVLKFIDVDVADPGPGEVRIRHAAIGLNYIDVYFRTGLYPAPEMPFIPGMEGAGEILAVGEGVNRFKEGDRIAYAGPMGAYSEERVIDASRIVALPEDISDETAAGMMLQGMTARYLLRATYRVTADTTLLFHAAAGGVGLIAGQWARKLGARVIGTAGTAEKCELALENGYDYMINYREEDFVERVNEITAGKGVDVVYDSVGKDTFPGSLDCLKMRGMWVSFGQSSGALPDVNLAILSQKGSLFATRPTLFNYIATENDLDETAHDLFEVVSAGDVKIAVNQKYALADAADAHRDLEARKTTGSTILIP